MADSWIEFDILVPRPIDMVYYSMDFWKKTPVHWYEWLLGWVSGLIGTFLFFITIRYPANELWLMSIPALLLILLAWFLVVKR